MLFLLTLTVENWIGVTQTVVMIAGVLFALRQLNLTIKQVQVAVTAATAAAQQTELAAKTSQAAALVSIEAHGTDILWKVIEDPALHGLFDEDVPPTGLAPEHKMALVRGMLIRHFANVFQLRQMGHISDSLWAAHKADMSTFFRGKPNERRWDVLKKYYDSDFRNFVDREILNFT